jgi:chromosome segregation ATPase
MDAQDAEMKNIALFLEKKKTARLEEQIKEITLQKEALESQTKFLSLEQTKIAPLQEQINTLTIEKSALSVQMSDLTKAITNVTNKRPAVDRAIDRQAYDVDVENLKSKLVQYHHEHIKERNDAAEEIHALKTKAQDQAYMAANVLNAEIQKVGHERAQRVVLIANITQRDVHIKELEGHVLSLFNENKELRSQKQALEDTTVMLRTRLDLLYYDSNDQQQQLAENQQAVNRDLYAKVARYISQLDVMGRGFRTFNCSHSSLDDIPDSSPSTQLIVPSRLALTMFSDWKGDEVFMKEYAIARQTSVDHHKAHERAKEGAVCTSDELARCCKSSYYMLFRRDADICRYKP